MSRQRGMSTLEYGVIATAMVAAALYGATATGDGLTGLFCRLFAALPGMAVLSACG